MTSFTKKTLQRLQQAGWYPGRSVDTSDFERALQENGYDPIPSNVQEFLSEFGGLQVHFVAVGHPHELHFDVKRASDVLYYEGRGAPCAEAIGKPFWPIGGMDEYELLIDVNGSIYGRYDPYLDLLGETGEEAIGALLTLSKKIVKRLLPYNDDTLREILTSSQVAAIVGNFDRPEHLYSDYQTARFLEQVGYTVYLVSPEVRQVEDIVCYPALSEIPGRVDIVDVFSCSEPLESVVEKAIAAGAKLIWVESLAWVELPVHDRRAALESAKNAGLEIVKNCSSMREVYKWLLP